MADMWVLDRYDNPLAILSSDAEDDACTFHSDQFVEKLNQGTEFSFSCDARHEDSLHVNKLNQVVFRDEDGFFRLFKIREIDRGNGDNGAEKVAHCEPAEMELLEAIVEDVRPTGKTQQYALDRVLEGTRWKGNVTAQTGIQSTNFYHISAYEAITKIIEVWGGELRFTVNFDEENNKIIERVVNIEQRRGNDEGDRFEVGYNVESITVTEMAYPVSALYGWGGSVETENGGDSRYIDFADVEWKVANGDPADKPKGQKWIELPGAKEKYGYKKADGAFINSFGQWQDENITDPKELLQKTYEHLRDTASEPQATYELKVIPTDHISLGDTRTAIDDTQADPIQIQSRVISLGYSISNPAGTKTVEMGEFLEVYQPDRRLDDLEDKVKNIDRNVQVTDGSFPDIVPPTPTNVTIKGIFDSVSMTWDYNPSSYIAAYEVYGSQTTGFTPSIENRLWRGKQSGFLHENAGVDNVWYYRVRAINYHGKASEFTPEISAKTQRIMTDDILHGAITADKLANLAVTADTISRNFEEANILPGSLLRISDLKNVDAKITRNEVEGFSEISVQKNTTSYRTFGMTTGGRNSLKLTKDETYTLSFELKRETLTDFTYLQVRENGGSFYDIPNNLNDLSNYPSDEFVRFDVVFNSPATLIDGRICLGGRTTNIADSGSFTVRKVQIRKGNVRKDFGFSPYDTQLTDGVITSALIAEAAVGSIAIQNAAIARAHLQEAIIDTVHIADAAITNAKIKDLSADKINVGTLKGITIEGVVIRGSRFETTGSSSLKSYIEANVISQYRKFNYNDYEELTITSGSIVQEYGSLDNSDNKEMEKKAEISRGAVKLSNGPDGASVRMEISAKENRESTSGYDGAYIEIYRDDVKRLSILYDTLTVSDPYETFRILGEEVDWRWSARSLYMSGEQNIEFYANGKASIYSKNKGWNRISLTPFFTHTGGQWGYADWRYNEYGFVELRGEVKGTTYTGDLEIGKIPTPDRNGAWICSNGRNGLRVQVTGADKMAYDSGGSLAVRGFQAGAINLNGIMYMPKPTGINGK